MPRGIPFPHAMFSESVDSVLVQCSAAHDMAKLLRHLFLVHGCSAYIRSDNGSEFAAERVKEFLADLGVDTLLIEPGSPVRKFKQPNL